MDTLTHWRIVDYRHDSLALIINGLEKAIKLSEDRMKLGGWYDGLWFMEDTEPIYGLAFIAFQNYINSSIADRFGNQLKKLDLYKFGLSFAQYERTAVELIIALANYTKHRDEGSLHAGTSKVLLDFKLNIGLGADIEESPIFTGLTILDKDWKLDKILNTVLEWRNLLWK